MAKLVFDKADVQRIVRHMMSATSYTRGYGDKKLARPQIVLVKDDGIYLMSNGSPDDDLGNGKRFVAYARGYDPSKGEVWDKCRNAVGGDDFAEYLDLSANFIAAITKGDFDRLEIGVTQSRISISLPGSTSTVRKLSDDELVKKLAKRLRDRIIFIKNGKVMTTRVMLPSHVQKILGPDGLDRFKTFHKAETILNLLPPAEAYRVYKQHAA